MAGEQRASGAGKGGCGEEQDGILRVSGHHRGIYSREQNPACIKRSTQAVDQQSQGTPQGHLPSWRCCPHSRPKPVAPWGNPETLRYFLAQYASASPSWPAPVHAAPCPSSGLVLVAQSCPTLFDPMDCSPPGSSVQGILQARILEWVAISFSGGSSQPRDQTQVSHIAGGLLYHLSHQERPCPRPI